MLDDDVLTRLLGEAAESFTIPEPVLEQPAQHHRRPSKRLVRWSAVAAAVVAGAFAVQSLGGSTPISKTQVQADRAAPGTYAPLVPAEAGPQTTGALSDKAIGVQRNAASSSQQLSARQFAAHPAAPASGDVTAPTAATVGDGFADSAKIVKTGSIALIVGDGKVSTVELKVEGIAAGVGGYVANQKSQEYGDDPSSTVTVRVPVDKFEQVVAQVRDQVKNGVGKVDSASTSGQDVTASYADVNAQIQSLTASRERFLVILGRANTIGETLSVQQRVDSVQQQIDSLKGRLRVLKDQTSMGTLTVTVSEKAKAEVKPHVQSGLSKSFDNAKHGFTSGVESIISRSGKGLLVLIVAVVGLVILRTGWRVARRRMV